MREIYILYIEYDYCASTTAKDFEYFEMTLIINTVVSGGSRNLRTGGRGCSFTHNRIKITLHIPNAFVVRVENKMHIVGHCMLITIKFMRVMQSNFSKNIPLNILTGGGGGGGWGTGLGPPLGTA